MSRLKPRPPERRGKRFARRSFAARLPFGSLGFAPFLRQGKRDKCHSGQLTRDKKPWPDVYRRDCCGRKNIWHGGVARLGALFRRKRSITAFVFLGFRRSRAIVQPSRQKNLVTVGFIKDNKPGHTVNVMKSISDAFVKDLL